MTATRPLWVLVPLYSAASLAHFVHNAEFIAFYPGMPAWLTRETVYLAWLGVTAFGVAGVAGLRLGFIGLGATLLAVYGLLGLDGLGHYGLALCSEHTLAADITIWFEAITGMLLAMACAAVLLSARPGIPA